MGDSSFSIQISTDLVNKLVNDGEQLKKRAKRPKPKLSRETRTQQVQNKVQENKISEDSKMFQGLPAAGWPVQPPLFAAIPTPQPANPDLDAIRSVVQDSEKVLERMQKTEETMTQEVTQRAKDLHDKEFKLPEQKPMPCLEKFDALSKCYKENQEDPLKCASLVKDVADCSRRVRQEVSSLHK